LQGEFTRRFLFKVLSIAIVASAIFRYYLFDLKRDVAATAGIARIAAWIAMVVVVASLVVGIVVAGTPQNRRLVRLDEQRVADLNNIQSQILYIYERDGILPQSLADVSDSTGRNLEEIVDPESGAVYEYRVISPLSFEICGNFSAVTDPDSQGRYYYEPRAYPLHSGENYYVEGSWEHTVGRQCFERVIRLSPAYDAVVPKPAPIR
jgi:hypothetical protein